MFLPFGGYPPPIQTLIISNSIEYAMINYASGDLSMVGTYTFADGIRLRVYEKPMFRIDRRERSMVLYAKVYFGKTTNKIYDYLTFIVDLKSGDDIIVQVYNGIAYAKFYGYSFTRGLGSKYIVAKVDPAFLDNKVERTSITIMPSCYGYYSLSAPECLTCKLYTLCNTQKV